MIASIPSRIVRYVVPEKPAKKRMPAKSTAKFDRIRDDVRSVRPTAGPSTVQREHGHAAVRSVITGPFSGRTTRCQVSVDPDRGRFFQVVGVSTPEERRIDPSSSGRRRVSEPRQLTGMAELQARPTARVTDTRCIVTGRSIVAEHEGRVSEGQPKPDSWRDGKAKRESVRRLRDDGIRTTTFTFTRERSRGKTMRTQEARNRGRMHLPLD